MSADRKDGQIPTPGNFHREGYPGETAQIVAAGFAPLTKEAFPHFFAAHRDSFQKLETPKKGSTTLVSLRYKTPPISKDSCLKLANTQVPAEMLINIQRPSIYSSRGVKVLSSKLTEQQWASYFTAEELEPDTENSEQQAYKDPWARRLLAVNLVLGQVTNDTNTRIENLASLRKYAQDKGCTFHEEDLRMAFTELVSDNFIDLLLEKETLTNNDLDNFYLGVSNWLVDLSGIREADVSHVSPYPFLDGLTPRPDFLPYLVRTFHKYFLDDVNHRMAQEEIKSIYKKLTELIIRSLNTVPKGERREAIKKDALTCVTPLRKYVMTLEQSPSKR